MRYILLLSILPLFLCFAGCEDNIISTLPGNGGTVAGIVFGAASSLPLSGATVSITPGGYVETTDVHGLWLRSNLDTGQHSITISKIGYRDTTLIVMVSSDSAVVRHVSMFFSPPTAGLIADYALDGDAVDGSGNGFHGVEHQTSATKDRFERNGAALHFDGSAYIDLGTNAALNLLNGFTLTAWMKDGAGSGIKNILTRWDMVDGVDERTYSIGVRNNDHPYFMISRDGTDAGAKVVDDPTHVEANQWVFVAATYDNSTMKLYIDGNFIGSVSQSGIRSSPNTRTGIGASIGRNGDPYGGAFRGAIDALRIYTRPLSPSEITILYEEM